MGSVSSAVTQTYKEMENNRGEVNLGNLGPPNKHVVSSLMSGQQEKNAQILPNDADSNVYTEIDKIWQKVAGPTTPTDRRNPAISNPAIHTISWNESDEKGYSFTHKERFYRMGVPSPIKIKDDKERIRVGTLIVQDYIDSVLSEHIQHIRNKKLLVEGKNTIAISLHGLLTPIALERLGKDIVSHFKSNGFEVDDCLMLEDRDKILVKVSEWLENKEYKKRWELKNKEGFEREKVTIPIDQNYINSAEATFKFKLLQFNHSVNSLEIFESFDGAQRVTQGFDSLLEFAQERFKEIFEPKYGSLIQPPCDKRVPNAIEDLFTHLHNLANGKKFTQDALNDVILTQLWGERVEDKSVEDKAELLKEIVPSELLFLLHTLRDYCDAYSNNWGIFNNNENRALYLAKSEAIVVQQLDGLAITHCRSSKDRTSIFLDAVDATFRLRQETGGQTYSYKNSSHLDRFYEIMSNLTQHGHHRKQAGRQMPGVSGLKTDFLPLKRWTRLKTWHGNGVGTTVLNGVTYLPAKLGASLIKLVISLSIIVLGLLLLTGYTLSRPFKLFIPSSYKPESKVLSKMWHSFKFIGKIMLYAVDIHLPKSVSLIKNCATPYKLETKIGDFDARRKIAKRNKPSSSSEHISLPPQSFLSTPLNNFATEYGDDAKLEFPSPSPSPSPSLLSSSSSSSLLSLPCSPPPSPCSSKSRSSQEMSSDSDDEASSTDESVSALRDNREQLSTPLEDQGRGCSLEQARPHAYNNTLSQSRRNANVHDSSQELSRDGTHHSRHQSDFAP